MHSPLEEIVNFVNTSQLLIPVKLHYFDHLEFEGGWINFLSVCSEDRLLWDASASGCAALAQISDSGASMHFLGGLPRLLTL